jgi:hypothetical protein
MLGQTGSVLLFMRANAKAENMLDEGRPREQGKVAPGAAADVAAALYEMGCYEVSMGDTTGVGTPASVATMFQARRRGPDPAQDRAAGRRNTAALPIAAGSAPAGARGCVH